jgi:hypothetical protein
MRSANAVSSAWEVSATAARLGSGDTISIS